VTVETISGKCRYRDYELDFVDLPGTYSLTAHSDDEREARRILLHNPPDVVVHVVDATGLARNLYLTVQLMELRMSLVLALNMSDEAEEKGIMPDVDLLSDVLGLNVVPTVGHKGVGVDDLKDSIVRCYESGAKPRRISFGRDIDRSLDPISERLTDAGALTFPPRYAAAKMLESDRDVITSLEEELPRKAFEEVSRIVDWERERLEELFGDTLAVVMAEHRHGVASGAAEEATMDSRTRSTGVDLTREIDNVLLSRVLGLPIFALAMYLTFWLTFTAGAPLSSTLEYLFGQLGGLLESALAPGLFRSLLVDGVIAGVGGVLVFVPNIALLFLVISVMEDTGYMARAAFLMDRFMHRIGLHGQSFIPMLIGFGCTVPAIMATRVLHDRRDRLVTMMILPLMSCSARLPVYLLIAGAFFPGHRALSLWIIYLVGILLAVGLAKLMRISVMKGENSPFVMELPPYRIPTLNGLLSHVWFRVRHYLRKAGTVILAFSVLLWLASSLPVPDSYAVDDMVRSGRLDPAPSGEKGTVDALDLERSDQVRGTISESQMEAARKAQRIESSIAGRTGHLLEPLLEPVGLDWRIGTALIGALGAKELFVSQLSILYSMGGSEQTTEGLREVMRRRYSPYTGISIALFVLIMAPCIATLAVVRKETGSWVWALGQYVGLTVLAYVVSLAFYQITRLLV
jgi:ferrous iron transport protein B